MVSSQTSNKRSALIQSECRRRRGLCMMEMFVLLLLYIPLTSAVENRHLNRSQTDIVSLIINTPKTHNTQLISAVNIHRESPRPTDTDHHQPTRPTLINMLSRSIQVRARRAVQKGCQFGTCQVHNLANTLYVMGQSSGKDQSKKARDPTGYGR